MKRRGRHPVAVPSRPASAARRARINYLFQAHPLPRSGDAIIAIALHLLDRFAVAQGKETPGLSKDAAGLLRRRYWTFPELARRLWSAVAVNRGNLITGAELSDVGTPGDADEDPFSELAERRRNKPERR